MNYCGFCYKIYELVRDRELDPKVENSDIGRKIKLHLKYVHGILIKEDLEV